MKELLDKFMTLVLGWLFVFLGFVAGIAGLDRFPVFSYILLPLYGLVVCYSVGKQLRKWDI
jgi:hypothetical protein